MSATQVTAFICDIDGTLALMHRDPFDWDLVESDLPNAPVIQVIHALIRAGENIVFMSGRMEQCREATVRWLAKHVPLSVGSPLMMRGDDDFRPDEVFKLEQLRILQDDGIEIIGVFDDRQKVVDMWRAEGLACFQVAPGNF